MISYLFFLGSTAELCFAELQAIARRLNLPQPELLNPSTAKIVVDTPIDSLALQDILGGTIKIARVLRHLDLGSNEVEEVLREILFEREVKRFVIAEHGRHHLEPIRPERLKAELHRDGRKVSYKDAPRTGANAALLKSSKATELHVWQGSEGIEIAVTESFQDVDTWSLRDVGKPHRDRKRGMLQPKIAHMMLNLAIGERLTHEQIVLDPFCGTGTVLIEATMLDVPVVLGSDLAPEAVTQSRANLAWWQEQLVEQFSTQIIISPVERLTPNHFSHQPTVIVTEPFLGKLTPKPEELPGIIRGLEKMYRGTFRAFARLLPSGGRVAILLPSYELGKHTLTVSNTLSDAEKMGFRLIVGPLRAGRPDAVTQRNVYVFEKSTAVI